MDTAPQAKANAQAQVKGEAPKVVSGQGKGAFFPGKRSKKGDMAGQCCKGDCKN
jgi:hypothetical protein